MVRTRLQNLKLEFQCNIDDDSVSDEPESTKLKLEDISTRHDLHAEAIAELIPVFTQILASHNSASLRLSESVALLHNAQLELNHERKTCNDIRISNNKKSEIILELEDQIASRQSEGMQHTAESTIMPITNKKPISRSQQTSPEPIRRKEAPISRLATSRQAKPHTKQRKDLAEPGERISIFADSHGKGVAQILRDLLPTTYRVEAQIATSCPIHISVKSLPARPQQ